MGGLAFVIEFPMPGRMFIRRVEDRLAEKFVFHYFLFFNDSRHPIIIVIGLEHMQGCADDMS